jgi:hypothetical protein
MVAPNEELMEQAEKLYEQYGKPLERDHLGRYAAIFPDGRFVIGHTRLEVLDKALSQVGPGSFLFKIGEKIVGKWR